jgi:hypothetical protein
MNPILSKIEWTINNSVSEENKDAYNKAVSAGKTILFNEKTHAHMQMVKNPESLNDPVNTIANGMAGLIKLMWEQSRKTIDPEVLILAGFTLMCEVFDFAERGMGLKIDGQMVADTTKLLGEKMFTKLGISKEQLQQAIVIGKQEIDDHNAKYPESDDPEDGGKIQPKPGLLSDNRFKGAE